MSICVISMSLFDVAIKLIHQETIFKLTVSLELLQYLTDFMNSGIGFFIESFIPFLSDFDFKRVRILLSHIVESVVNKKQFEHSGEEQTSF